MLQQQVWEPKLRFFSPSYFPNIDITLEHQESNRVVFVILGEVDNARRNYQSLIDCFETIAHSRLKHQIEIRLMGRATNPDAVTLLDTAHREGLLPAVVKWQNSKFIPFSDYANLLASSHFVLLLLDNQISVGYNRTVVPSSLILSRAFAVPPVYSTDFPLDDDLLPYSIAYKGSTLLEGIMDAVESVESGQYADMRRAYAKLTENQYNIYMTNYLH